MTIYYKTTKIICGIMDFAFEKKHICSLRMYDISSAGTTDFLSPHDKEYVPIIEGNSFVLRGALAKTTYVLQWPSTFLRRFIEN